MKFTDFVRESTLKKEDVDRFLDPNASNWAKFDPEVGYTLSNFMPRDGLDKSLTISTAQPNGARTSCIYAHRPCRINTYGNSFTQCHQVSDHETWQEYLAAHLGEPIRNFGMGGFGVYQAYRRMLRTEASALGAEYVILYIWGDDHYRSLLRCRHVFTHRWAWKHASMFHANFWANLELDLDSGKFVERDNMLPTPESLYRMTDPDFMVNAVKDDWMLQMMTFVEDMTEDVDVKSLNRLAEVLGCVGIAGSERKALQAQVRVVYDAYAFAATRYILDRAAAFVGTHRKKLLVALYCPQVTRTMILGGPRYEQPVVDYLREREFHYFDMNLVHVEDFKQFNLPVDQYMKRYSIGHYSPKGNHFFAFAIKDDVVEWLDPKPITYRTDEQARIDFDGYLPAER